MTQGKTINGTPSLYSIIGTDGDDTIRPGGGQWTGWENRRFYGESVIQCLAKALIAMQESRDD